MSYTILPLERVSEPLLAEVNDDELTREAVRPFDLQSQDLLGFYPWKLPDVFPRPDEFQIGVIVGASGSGKSCLIENFGGEKPIEWQEKMPIVSSAHFSSVDEACSRMYAVGLNSVPVWRKPYSVLSNGQKFRADLSRRIGNNAVVDEFTSVVDRNVAKSASRAIHSWTKRNDVQNQIFATCHRDIIPWLNPDWVIDTDSGMFLQGTLVDEPRWWAEFVTQPAPVGSFGFGAASC